MADLFSCGKTSETHTISHYHVQISNLIDSQRLVLPLALCCTSHGSFRYPPSFHIGKIHT